jgi:hypothetical protein
MKCNVSKTDRSARTVIGIGLLLIAVLLPGLDILWRIAAGLVALVALITAYVRYCPVNDALGIGSCESHPGDLPAGQH